jgi:hypothetical protein
LIQRNAQYWAAAGRPMTHLSDDWLAGEIKSRTIFLIQIKVKEPVGAIVLVECKQYVVS